MRRPHRHRSAIRVEPLEDRSVPAFVTAGYFPVGTSGGENSKPDGIAVADFNRDGKPDIATANPGQDSVSILLGTGTGRFAPAKNLVLGRKPVNVTAADVNGDGKPDIVTANAADNSVTVLLGNGLGGFVSAGTVGGLNKPVDVGVGDFNGDGKVDLAAANQGANSVTILLGQGKGKFLAGPVLTTGNSPTAIAVADFNGDTLPDFATTSGGFGHLDVTLNLGSGTFAPARNWATGFCANDLAVADFNGDQKLDIAIGCTFPAGEVNILLGVGDGTFLTFAVYNAGHASPRSIAVGDVNGDGHPDVVTANDGFVNNSVSVLTNKGDGTLNIGQVFAASIQPLGVAVGDFNRDGLADLASTNTGLPSPRRWGGPIGTVAVLLGNGDGSVRGAPGLAVQGAGGIATGDITGDGLPDLAVITSGTHRGFYVYPGLGNGLFGDRFASPLIDGASMLAVGNFNGDQYGDVAVITSQQVWVLNGTGTGGFATPVAYAPVGSARFITVADVNGDQKTDLILTTTSGVSIHLGNGDGTFQPGTGVVAGGDSTHVAVADLNKDGKQDLAVVSDPNRTVTVLLGNGDGTFALSQSYSTQVGPGSVTVGDYNRDGRPDLAVPTFFGPGLMVFQNKGAGKFFLKGEFDNDSLPQQSLSVDVNGDGKLDVLTANAFASTVTVFPGTGYGTFGKRIRYSVGDGPKHLVTADFNGDGRPDVAVGTGSEWVTLLMTPAPVHHLRVTTNAATVRAGQPVTVTVTAVDTAGHPARTFAGTVSFSSTDPKAVLPLPTRFTAADLGVKRFVITPKTAGDQTIRAHAAGLQLGTAAVSVTAATAVKLKLVSPTTATAGTGFDLIVQAVDAFGNPDPTYTGTVHFTTTDVNAAALMPADYTFTSDDNGSHTFADFSLRTAGLRSITVAGGTWKATAAVKVTAGALFRFDVTGLSTPVTANLARSITVVAKDAYGNTITNYAGTVTFSNTGGTALLPAAYTFKPAELGKHVFKVTFQTPGADQTLTVADQNDPSIVGTVTGITVV